jgi:hypothetical protein
MFCRVESILEGGPNVNNRSFWIKTIPFGAPESIDLIEPRVFQEEKCVLCALEGIGSEFGLTVDSLRGYLPSTVEALLLALFYYVVVNRTDEDKWVRNVGRFVAEHANRIALEQRRQGVDDHEMYFALINDRESCFKNWRIFQYSNVNDNTSNTENFNKKRKTINAFIQDDIVQIAPPSQKPRTASTSR